MSRNVIFDSSLSILCVIFTLQIIRAWHRSDFDRGQLVSNKSTPLRTPFRISTKDMKVINVTGIAYSMPSSKFEVLKFREQIFHILKGSHFFHHISSIYHHAYKTINAIDTLIVTFISCQSLNRHSRIIVLKSFLVSQNHRC